MSKREQLEFIRLHLIDLDQLDSTPSAPPAGFSTFANDCPFLQLACGRTLPN